MPLPESDDLPDDEDFGHEITGDLPVPEYWMEDDEVEHQEFRYSTRDPSDWVISGPLGKLGAGPGRRFANWTQAERWAREFYGARFRGRIAEAAVEGHNRWAFLIKGPRG